MMIANITVALSTLRVAGYCALGVVVVALLSGTHFDASERTAILALSLCFPLSYVIGLSLVAAGAKRGRGPLKTKTLPLIVTLLITFVPPILLLTRFQIMRSWGIDIIAATQLFALAAAIAAVYAIFQRDKKGLSSWMLILLSHYEWVMTGQWVGSYEHELATDSPLNQRSKRQRAYTHEESLRIFQDTTTCGSAEAKWAAQQILASQADINRSDDSPSPDDTGLSILDIGGAEGRTTAQFISHLCGHGLEVNSLMLVDPVLQLDQYQHNVRDVCPELRIDSSKAKLTQFISSASSPALRYDIVLAFHSLYNELDGYEVDNRVDLLTQLVKSTCRPFGHLVISLASQNGSSYKFKQRALERLWTSSGPQDSVAEFSRDLPRIGDWSSTIIDSVFDLSDMVCAENRSRCSSGRRFPLVEKSALNWLLYFLRLPQEFVETQPAVDVKSKRDEVLDLFASHLLVSQELPACILESLGPSFRIEPKVVLPHKSKVFVVRFRQD